MVAIANGRVCDLQRELNVVDFRAKRYRDWAAIEVAEGRQRVLELGKDCTGERRGTLEDQGFLYDVRKKVAQLESYRLRGQWDLSTTAAQESPAALRHDPAALAPRLDFLYGELSRRYQELNDENHTIRCLRNDVRDLTPPVEALELKLEAAKP